MIRVFVLIFCLLASLLCSADDGTFDNLTVSGLSQLGKAYQTYTQTSTATQRPVINSMYYYVDPDGIPDHMDFHGLDLLLKGISDVVDQNTRFYTFETNAQYSGTGHMGTLVPAYILGQNFSTGELDDVWLLRMWTQNNSTGYIHSIKGIKFEDAGNSGGGTIDYQYAIYIPTLSAAGIRNTGIYNLAPNNYFSKNISIGSSASNVTAYPFFLSDNPTIASGTYAGSYISITPTPAVDSSAMYYGLFFKATPNGAHNYSAGFTAARYEAGTGVAGSSIAKTTALEAVITNMGAGSATDARGLRIQNSGNAGSIFNAYGIDIDANTSSGTNAIGNGNKYGLRIGDISGAPGSNYAIKTGLGKVSIGGDLEITGAFLPRVVASDPTVTGTPGKVPEIVYCPATSKWYGCRTTGNPGSWIALN